MNTRSDDSFSQRRHALGIFFTAFVLLCLKSRDALTHPQLWAEDGAVLLKQQIEQDGLLLSLLFAPYADYLHAFPRLVAWLASFASVEFAPLIYNASAITFAAVSIYICTKNLRTVIPPYLVLATFLLTPTDGEVFGTITNLQWFLQLPLVTYCFVATKSSNPLARYLLNGLLLVIALTGPFSIFCTMLMALVLIGYLVLRIARRSNQLSIVREYFEQRDFVCWALVAACALVQIMFIYGSAPKEYQAISAVQLVVGALGQAAPIHLLGFSPLHPVIWLFLYAVAIVYLLFFSKLAPAARIGMFLILAFVIVEVLAGVHKVTLEPLLKLGGGDRYFFAFKLVFWWIFFIALKDLLGSERNGAKYTLLFMLCVALLNFDDLRRPRFTDYGPASELRKFDQPGTHTFLLNPRGWQVTITRKE